MYLRTLSTVLFLGILGCGNNDHAGTGTTTEAENALSLHIVDLAGSPVPNARVDLCLGVAPCTTPIASDTSDAQGAIWLSGLADGSFTLLITDGTLSETLSVTLSGGQTVGKDRTLVLDGLTEEALYASGSVVMPLGTYVTEPDSGKYKAMNFAADGSLKSETYFYGCLISSGNYQVTFGNDSLHMTSIDLAARQYLASATDSLSACAYPLEAVTGFTAAGSIPFVWETPGIAFRLTRHKITSDGNGETTTTVYEDLYKRTIP